MKSNSLCLGLLGLSLCLQGTIATPRVAAQEAPKKLLTTVLVDTAQAPVLDGRLDEAAWNRPPEVTGFSQIAPGNLPSKFPTFVRCLYDAHNLYLGFRCQQPRDTLKLTSAPDGDVWNDDCIELFLSPDIKNGQLQTLFPDDQHYHLIFNAAGTKFDELGNGGAASWNGDWQVKTSVQDDGWQAEVKIPFAAVSNKAVAPWPFQIWNLQIGRSLAKDGERATLFLPQGLYRNHSAFGSLVFVDNPQDEATVRWHLDKGSVVTPRLERLSVTIVAMQPSQGDAFRPQIQSISVQAKTLAADFATIAASKYTPDVRAAFLAKLAALETTVRSLQEQRVLHRIQQAGNNSGIALAPHPPVRDADLVKPDFLPPLAAIGRPVTVDVTPDQYQAASFVLWTSRAQKDVLIQATDFTSEAKVKPASLPSGTVDIRWVKCWYQAGNNEVIRGPSVLTPELLLKNPDLVTVDLKAEKNITFITPDMEERGYPGDSPNLLPQKTLGAKTSTQVWLTIHVPRGTPAGRYRSMLKVTGGGKILGTLPLVVNVLDFQLAPSMLEHAWYARTMWGGSRWGQTRARALAEAKNMVRHGVTNVGLIEEPEELEKALGVMREAGMKTDTLYIVGDHGAAYFPYNMDPAAAEKQAANWVAISRKLGVQQIYLYLQDEARDEILKAERPVADAIHRAGAKTWVAGYSDYYPDAGDFIDATIQAFGIVDPSLVKKIHAGGSKIYSYAHPQAGVERPEIYRRNYGLLLWQNDYDGAFDWQWYQTFGPTNTRGYNPWDDFIAPAWRQACMVYPTKDGVVDTIQWEGWREGVTDCRYMATLLREIAAAKKAGRVTPAIRDAETWVQTLKSGGSAALQDLDSIRATMIRQIKACRAGL